MLIKEGKGKNATEVFDETNLFTAGDAVVIRGVVTLSDAALAGASVTVTIDANTELSAMSDEQGNFEVIWETTAPNKKGVGGTDPGDYTAVVTSVISDEGTGLEVNTETSSVLFTIQ